MTEVRRPPRIGRIRRVEATAQTDARVDELAAHELEGGPARPAPRTTVIIPAYNEEEGLSVVLGKMFSVVDDTYEVIVVDDGSTDGTAEAAARFPCRVLTHATNRGKGEAMRTGIRAARGENLIFIDADDTYPVELIPQITSRLDAADMVLASRARGKRQIPAFNRLGNAIFRNLIRHLYGFRPCDPLTGLYGIKRAHLLNMRLDSSGFGIETEIAIKAARMGLRTYDISIEYRPRLGEAKLRGLEDGYRIFQTIVKMLTLYNPTLTFVLPGIVLFGAGTFFMASLMVYPLTVGDVSLETHSFVLAAMLTLAGFHLGVFGFALSLYAATHKFVRTELVTKLFLRQRMGGRMASLGLLLLATGLGLGAWLGLAWAKGGLGAFEETKGLILASFLAVFGLQTALSSVFLSIFVNELKAAKRQERIWR